MLFIISFNGIKFKDAKNNFIINLILLGLYIGNYIDEIYFSNASVGLDIIIMLIYIIISVLFVSKYLQKFSKYEKKTSIFSAAPGALGPLLIIAEDEKSDLSHVATSHLIRLVIIITVFPLIVNSFYDVKSIELPKNVFEEQNIIDLFILVTTSIILIYLFNKCKIPAALLSGTLVASGFLQITELASYRISPDIIDYCLLILGASVGCRFVNKTFIEIGKNAFHSFVATFLVIFGLIAAYVKSHNR